MHGRGHVRQVGCAWPGVCMVEACVVGETATKAGGTHPTGMGSC